MSTPSVTLPARAEGLELLGTPGGSGYEQSQALIRRADGQTLQLTPLLYQLLELLDGQRDESQLAHELSRATARHVTDDDIRLLLDKLAPLGALAGTEPETHATSNPLLALRFKVVASKPETTRRITAPFAALFSPLVLWPVLAAFVGVCWFVLVDKGLASATRQAFDTPGLLLAVFALTVLSAGFHELGHAAACRYGGATPGAMGAGIYLVWPAFYTNVDDSYRLDRKGRLRVDLGGLYFNALVAVVVTGLWFATGVDALLLGVATQLLQMLRQLAPVFRADGYHILADLTGVPDLFAHLGPTVKRVLPRNWGTPSPLTRKARIIVTAWVLIVVPVIVSMMLTAVLLLPRLLATAWTSGQVRGRALGHAAEAGDLLGIGAGVLELLALLLPVVGTTYLVGRVVRSALTGTWTRTEGRPFLRGTALATLLVLLAALLWTWWPNGQYRPIRADERGTVTQLVSAANASQSVPVHTTALAMIPQGGATEAHPILLLQRKGDALSAVVVGKNGVGRAFPFTLPSAPRPGDNQAVALNGTDGSTVYDVAVVLLTLTDGQNVGNANTAYALASCTRCRTVAVAFQVLLIVGHSDYIAPVNAAVAGNKYCLQCVTTALAQQLVITLRDTPSPEVQAQLQAAMARLGNLNGLDPALIYSELASVQRDIVTTLTNAGLVDAVSSTSASASATPDASTSASASAAPSDSATPDPLATTAPTPTDAATVAPTPTDTGTPAPTDTPTP